MTSTARIRNRRSLDALWLAIGSVSLVAVTVPAALASALLLGSHRERQIRARRTFDTVRHPRVLSNFASEPHLGIGDQLLAEVVSRADSANADLVLTLGEDNGIARALFTRHHVILIDGRGQTIHDPSRPRAVGPLSESQL